MGVAGRFVVFGAGCQVEALEPIEKPSAIKLATPKIRMTALEIPAPADAATTAKVVTVPSTAP